MSDVYIVTITILVLLVVLIKDLVTPSIAFLGAVIVSMITGIITSEEALSGFSSQVLFIIGSLLVITRAMQNSVNSVKVVNRLLGKSPRLSYTLARLTLPVAAASGVVANTPIVASLINPLEQWAQKHQISISKLLMPLSFAAVLGGVLTLVGTSTNLVISGLLAESGYQPLEFFEITKLGLPVAVVGLIVLIFQAPKFLPTRKAVAKKGAFKDSITEYEVEKRLDGKSIEQAGLRNLNKLFLAVLIRKGGDIIAPVDPKTVLRIGDTLQFVGDIKDVASLDELPGIKLKAGKHQKELGLKSSSRYEVVLGHESPAINRTLKEMNFRGYYQAAVFAIHRSGERIKGKLGEVKLKVGDTLVVVSDDYFDERWGNGRDFLLVSKMETKKRFHKENIRKLTMIAAVSILLAISGVELITILMTAAVLSVVSGVVTIAQARRSIDFDLLILIASSISFATAVVNSGLSEKIADVLIDSLGGFGGHGLLLGTILCAIILTELVTNTASASLLYPVVLSSALGLGLEPRLFVLVLAVACSLSFLSPLGYQTNTMVFGPGGYKFTDYLKFGSTLTFVSASTLFIVAANYL